MKSLQIYALMVCFATLMCFVIALGIALYDVVEISSPKITSTQLSWYSTTERYLHYHPDKKSLPAEEIETLRQMENSLIVESTRQAAMQSLVFASIILAIDVVVFAIHWRIANAMAGSGPRRLDSFSESQVPMPG